MPAANLAQPPEPDDVARALARLLPRLLDGREQADLLSYINLMLRASAPAVRRAANLGLVIELILEHGELPNSQRYDEALEQRRAAGEQWPDRTTLFYAFGEWHTGVLRAAVRYLDRGGRHGLSDSFAHAHVPITERRYEITMSGIAKAIIDCRNVNGRWPTFPEYLLWGSLERRLARHVPNAALPKIPQRAQVLRHFPHWEGAVAFARVKAGEARPVTTEDSP